MKTIFVYFINKTFVDLHLALRYSLAGIRAAWRQERAFRQELAILTILAPVALWLGRTGTERALLIASWLLVIVIELVNSAIETAVDRIGSEWNELSGRAKDLGSASVFCAIILAATVWMLVLTG